jgi:hypothetical protein
MAADERIEELYGLALEEFTAARNALAKELRASDREAAERVKALRKPSAAAWALNQAVRREPGRLKEFLEAAGELREAHEGLLAGGEREPLEAATAREREAAGALVDAAQEAAGGGGPGLRDRVASTLRAAVADDEARAELEAGRVVREREAVGLGPFGAPPAEGGRRTADRKAERKRTARRELDEAREHEQRAQRRARDAGQSVAAAKERAEAAMEALERAQREEEQARAAAEEAGKEVKGLERRLKG